MSLETQYQTFPNIDLSIAGRERHTGPFGYLKVVSIVDADGNLALDGVVNVRVGTYEADPVPLRIDGEVAGMPGAWDQFEISWDAQPGYKATVLAAYDPRAMSISAEPSSQLLLGTPTVSAEVTLADAYTAAEQTFLHSTAVAGVASKYSVVQLFNPAASGKKIYVEAVNVLAFGAATRVILNQSNVVRALGAGSSNKTRGGASSVASMYGDNLSAMGAGIFHEMYLPANQSLRHVFSRPVVLGEGKGVEMVIATVNQYLVAGYEWTQVEA